MRAVLFASLFVFGFAAPATADPCDDLIMAVQGAISSGGVTTELEKLLESSRAAKAAGNVSACEAALTGSTQSPAPGKHECESTQDKTV